jgi:hypothetical protein
MDITARIKVGTADSDKGLGSGRNDYAIQWSGFREGSQWGVFGTLGYKWLGAPEGVTLRNVQFATAGVSYRANKNSRFEMSLETATASRSGSSIPLELILDYRHTFSDRFRLNVYALRGFSSASPDLGFGTTLTYYFD